MVINTDVDVVINTDVDTDVEETLNWQSVPAGWILLVLYSDNK